MTETFLHLLERQAQVTPDACALVDTGRCWTYRHLLAAIHQRAYVVLERTRTRQPRVGLLVDPGERTAETLLWFLGILRAGAVGVPIDAATPRDRFDALVEDAQLTWLCGHRQSLHLFAQTRTWPQLQALDLEAGEQTLDAVSQAEPIWAPEAEDLASILPTTGTTTGRPKGGPGLA